MLRFNCKVGGATAINSRGPMTRVFAGSGPLLCVVFVGLLQVYGLHANADISKNQQETNQLLDSLLASQGSGGGSSGGRASSGGSRESILLQVASELDSKLRKPFDIEAAQYK